MGLRVLVIYVIFLIVDSYFDVVDVWWSCWRYRCWGWGWCYWVELEMVVVVVGMVVVVMPVYDII